MSIQRFLSYGRQHLDDDDVEAVVAVLGGDALTQGRAVEAFEEALAHRVGARHAVVVSNGTAALHIACMAAGVAPGDRGVTATLTFVASANCLHYAGGEADLCDVDPVDLGVSAQALTTHLTRVPATKVVLPVHFAGLAHDAAGVRAAAGGRVVIEDASHSLGGCYEDGRPVGCGDHADMSVFSFHPVKPITTGEGGAVVTNDAELARRLRMLRNHGIEREADRFERPAEACEDDMARPWYYEQQILGYNYRMTDLQAALGLTQLAKLDRFVARRRAIALHYDAAFRDLGVAAPVQAGLAQRARSAHHIYVLAIDFAALGRNRPTVMGQLREAGIGTQVHYIPVHRQPFHARRGFQPADFPVAEAYYAQALTVPLHPGLSDAEIEYVVGTVKRVLGA